MTNSNKNNSDLNSHTTPHSHTTPDGHTTPDRAAARRNAPRRAAIVGVSGGALVGGLVGLAMTVPSITAAAGDGTAAVTALQQTDGTSDDTSGETSDGAERPEPGVRLRAALQPLVDDGTLTVEQAEAVAGHLAAHRADRLPDRDGRGGRGGRPGFDGEVVAGLLGIEASELRSALRDGQTIADVAEANGVDVQVVIDALVDEAASHLDLAVENGRLTEDEAAERLVDVTERITALVNGERPHAD